MSFCSFFFSFQYFETHPYGLYVALKVKVVQSCAALCNPIDCVHGILQTRLLEWIAFPFSRGYSQPRDRTQVSYIADEFFTN